MCIVHGVRRVVTEGFGFVSGSLRCRASHTPLEWCFPKVRSAERAACVFLSLSLTLSPRWFCHRAAEIAGTRKTSCNPNYTHTHTHSPPGTVARGTVSSSSGCRGRLVVSVFIALLMLMRTEEKERTAKATAIFDHGKGVRREFDPPQKENQAKVHSNLTTFTGVPSTKLGHVG